MNKYLANVSDSVVFISKFNDMKLFPVGDPKGRDIRVITEEQAKDGVLEKLVENKYIKVLDSNPKDQVAKPKKKVKVEKTAAPVKDKPKEEKVSFEDVTPKPEEKKEAAKKEEPVGKKKVTRKKKEKPAE